jgi:aryl-alcohol dehydrogenase-like predicted oxidoreductase
MKFRILGKTGLKVSVVGVGTWQFGGEWGRPFSQELADPILGRAKELGINLIDTAECYGDHLSETLIGTFLRGQNRQQWVVASKFGHKFHANFNRSDAWDAASVISSVEVSLHALQTDYIDLLQFHSGRNEVFDNQEMWSALHRLVQSGKVRHLGLSVSPNDNIYQVSRAAQVGIETVQVIYNRLDRQAEAEVLPSCQAQNLGVLSRVPLASGLLSGKYHPGDTFTDPEDIRSKRDPAKVEDQLRQVEEIHRAEVPSGLPMAAWALAWCLKNPAVTCVIPGCKSPSQVEANAACADLV